MENQEKEIQTSDNQDMEIQTMDNQEMEIKNMTDEQILDEQLAYAIQMSIAEKTGAGCEAPEPKKRIFRHPETRPIPQTGSQRTAKCKAKKRENEIQAAENQTTWMLKGKLKHFFGQIT